MTTYLSTPCVTPDCRHSFNWHKASACAVKGCGCVAFAAQDDTARAAANHPHDGKQT